MSRIDLVSLRLFASVADAGSLTGAAAREHLALAAVSKRVRDLEQQLATPLLYRRPRGVELTPAGDALLHHARTVLANLESLQAELSEYRRGVRGHVRMHANTSAIIEFLPEDLAAFSRAHRQVKIDLQESLSTEAIHAVREGLTDIGVFANVADASDLQHYFYRRDRLVLVTPHKHALAARQGIHLADALDEDFIGLQDNASLHRLLTAAAREAGRTLRMRIQVRSFEGICRMIARGMGVGMLPANAVTHLSGLPLAVVDLRDAWAERSLHVGVRDYGALSVIGREMVDHLCRAETPDAESAESA